MNTVLVHSQEEGLNNYKLIFESFNVFLRKDNEIESEITAIMMEMGNVSVLTFN